MIMKYYEYEYKLCIRSMYYQYILPVLEVCITSIHVNIVILMIIIYVNINSKVLHNDVDELCLQ